MLKIREQEILDYIGRYINEYGFSPIVCEIGEGYIKKTVEQPRTIRILEVVDG